MIALPQLLLAVLLQGCSCQPELPSPPPPNTNPPDTQTTEEPDETADTAVDRECPFPAVEPNDLAQQGTPLKLERIGCGDFSEPLDTEWWTFELPRDDWLGIRVDAKSLGSIADVHLILNHESGSSADRLGDQGSTDATLLYPARAGRYEMNIREQNGQGGDRYFYEVLATVSKPPVEWTRVEAEPNDTNDAAETVRSGDAIFGGMSETADSDWYVLAVPEGRHTVTIDVDAFAYGSSADLSVFLFRPDLEPLPLGCDPRTPCRGPGCVSCEVTGPPSGFALDPYTEYESLGDEVLYIRVGEASLRSGDAVWYVVRFTLEGA